MGIDRSKEFWARAQKVLPGGVNSPVRAFGAVGGIPRFIERGEGPWLYDVDGNKYLDLCCSWGPLILGHADPDVVAAIEYQVDRGTTFGATTELECRLAEFIVEAVAPVEQVRFVSSGTEAVMSAIRLARGFTGRDTIVKFDGCYHGHADHLLVKAGSGLATFGQPSSAGVPESFSQHTVVLPLDDEQCIADLFAEQGDKIAAVVIEGIPANNGLLVQRPEYMKLLRQITDKYGALLILDEVITGFRIGLGGAAKKYRITPDLLTYGKVIGGGMPVGAFGGRQEIMRKLSPEGPVYQAGTLSGNPVAMAAGLATLEKVNQVGFYRQLDKSASVFAGKLRENLPDRKCIVAREDSIVWLAFQPTVPKAADQIDSAGIDLYNRGHNDVLESGVYIPPSGYEVAFVSAAHTEEHLTEAAQKIAGVYGQLL